MLLGFLVAICFVCIIISTQIGLLFSHTNLFMCNVIVEEMLQYLIGLLDRYEREENVIGVVDSIVIPLENGFGNETKEWNQLYASEGYENVESHANTFAYHFFGDTHTTKKKKNKTKKVELDAVYSL